MSNYQDLVDGVAKRLQAKGIAAEPIVKDGEPGKVIIKEAKLWGADLIIMGSHGDGPIKRLIMGSVSQYVTEHAPCSVELVHRKETQRNE